jgi:predicted nucleotidyltransferase
VARISPQELSRLIPHFAAHPEIAVAYVFGSVARGKARPDSDLDIGIVYRRFDRSGALHGRIAPALAHAIGRELGIEAVDVVDLEAQGPFFCHHVLLESRIVYEADSDRRVDFESDAIVRGLDFRPTWELATRGKASALRRWIREHR